MIRSFLESLEPDQHALFEAIVPHVTDDMLERISVADYASNADIHLIALRRLRDTGEMNEPIHWYPCEVLELIRNSEPDIPEWRPGSTGVRGHWMRAFSSSALLRAQGPPWEYTDAANPSYTLIQLIRSLSLLPVDLSRETIRLIAWFMLRNDLEGKDAQPIYFGIALLFLTLRQVPPSQDRSLIELAEWIVKHEEEIRQNSPWAFDRWLLGVAFDPPPSPWESLGADLLELDLRNHSAHLREWVALIGSKLIGENTITGPGA